MTITKQKLSLRYSEQTREKVGEGGGEGPERGRGLRSANYYIQNTHTTRTCCTAQGYRGNTL